MATKRMFNDGKPYHGSEAVLQILDFDIVRDGPVEYSPDKRPGAERDFGLVFKLRCAQCQLVDFVKIANHRWQGGKITDSPNAPIGIY